MHGCNLCVETVPICVYCGSVVVVVNNTCRGFGGGASDLVIIGCGGDPCVVRLEVVVMWAVLVIRSH